MSRFDNNPMGKVLAWACGGLAVVSLLMVWAFYWPVTGSSTQDEAAAQAEAERQAAIQASELGPLSEYQVVNDRPVFNESRQPDVAVEVDGEGIEIVEAAVADAPDVRLTGVIITPDQRMATLSQNAGGDPLIAHEGSPLDGEYVGWTVASVEPRKVRLESTEGESFELELSVHDQVINEPPRPDPPPSPQNSESVAQADGEGEPGAEGEPLSRAEEIRRRIAERREQLRREADQQAADENNASQNQRSEYQQAIQNMLQRSRSSEDGNDDESGNENDD